MNIFEITGSNFFKALTGKYQDIFADCLEIIYKSYRTELSYGVDREIIILQLIDYFDEKDSGEIQFDDEGILTDSRTKASEFMRKLRAYGWIEYEFDNNGKAKVVMPDHAVTIMQALTGITTGKEMEYQSEISAIYSMLTNEELLDRPYPQIIRPVYDRTLALFTELKKLNTNIKKYIEELTDGQSPDELMEHYFDYIEKIGTKAYHRMMTNDNILRFRNTIIGRLKNILEDKEIMDKAAAGYQNIESENDKSEAYDKVIEIITNVIGHFESYDDIEKEIKRKHAKYLKNAVSRAKFAFLHTNNIEGKLSLVLKSLANALDREDDRSLYDEIPDDYCRIFNIFPQNFISGESLKTVAITKKMGEIEEIYAPQLISEEEAEQRRRRLKEKNANRFSRKNITNYVQILLEDKNEINASEIKTESNRDMIRLIFIGLYGRDKKSEYIVLPKDVIISGNGFTFKDFTIKRRVK